MGKIKAVLDLIRPHEYLPHFILVLLVPVAIFRRLEVSLIYIIFFIIFISAFGFVINDIADLRLDRLDKRTRNPIAKSEISKSNAAIISFLFLIMALYFLFLLPQFHVFLGILIGILSILYSFILRAKSLPPFDLIFHGLWPTLFFLMSYTLYAKLDAASYIIALVIFSLSCLAELLQEVRDFSNDKKLITNTVIKIGQEAAIKLSIVFILFSIFAGGFLVYSKFLSPTMLLIIPLSYFIIHPLLVSLKARKMRKGLIYIYAKRVIFIGVILFILSYIK